MNKKELLKKTISKNTVDKETIINNVLKEINTNKNNSENIIYISEIEKRSENGHKRKTMSMASARAKLRRISVWVLVFVLFAAGGIFGGYNLLGNYSDKNVTPDAATNDLKNTQENISENVIEIYMNGTSEFDKEYYKLIEYINASLKIKSGKIKFKEVVDYTLGYEPLPDDKEGLIYESVENNGNIYFKENNGKYDFDYYFYNYYDRFTLADANGERYNSFYNFQENIYKNISGKLYSWNDIIEYTNDSLVSSGCDTPFVYLYNDISVGIRMGTFFSFYNADKDNIISIEINISEENIIYKIIANNTPDNDTFIYTINSDGIIVNMNHKMTRVIDLRESSEINCGDDYEIIKQYTLNLSLDICDVIIKGLEESDYSAIHGNLKIVDYDGNVILGKDDIKRIRIMKTGNQDEDAYTLEIDAKKEKQKQVTEYINKFLNNPSDSITFFLYLDDELIDEICFQEPIQNFWFLISKEFTKEYAQELCDRINNG